MKLSKLLIGAFALFSFTAFAGAEGGVGNGGYSVVCRDSSKNIISAELLDIYEGKIRYKKEYKDDLGVDAKIEFAQRKLARHSKFLSEFQEELAIVKNILKPIPEGHVLMPTEDAFPAILREGCEFEQVANYTDDGELLVSYQIYNKFNNLNKAALLVHETVYAIFRKAGAKDSRQSRKLIAELLSENSNQKVIDEILEQNGKSLSEVCGLEGNIKKRIKNCNKKVGDFVLVSKMHDGFTVYKELETELLWSSPLPKKMNFYDALDACETLVKEKTGITDVTWRLPRDIDFNQIENAFRNIFPQRGWVWTSSRNHFSPDFVQLFIVRPDLIDINNDNRSDDYILLTRDYVGGTVQCVAR